MFFEKMLMFLVELNKYLDTNYKIKEGYDFAYNFYSKTVLIPKKYEIIYETSHYQFYPRWLYKNGATYKVFSLHPITLYMLHEVGHHMTLNEGIDRIGCEEAMVNSFMMDFGDFEEYEMYELYYENNIAETLANEWVIDFLNVSENFDFVVSISKGE